MEESKTRYVATIIIAAFVIIVMSIFNIDINEAKNYQNVTENAIILKLDTNKLLVNGAIKMVDSENPRTMPYLDENSRTLVPARCISENLGAIVSWDEDNQIVTIAFGPDVIKFTIGSKYIDKNGTKSEMDTSAIIYEDRTYIPLRALVEVGLNKAVYWEETDKLIIISEDNKYVQDNLNEYVATELVKQLDSLSVVGNFEVMKKLVNADELEKKRTMYDINGVDGIEKASESSSLEDSSNETTDYSKTNTQVENVDEADIVKTDGRYIYYLSREKLVIVDTIKPEAIKTIKEVEYEEEDNVSFNPQELYLNGNTLVVVGTETKKIDIDVDAPMAKMIWYPTFRYDTMTKAICYDVSNPNNMIEKRTVKTDGYYVDSRMIGEDVYLISNKYMYLYNVDFETINGDELKPAYYDSTVSNECVKVDYSNMCYFPEIEDTSYTMIASFNVNNLLNANIETYLGMSENLYMSEDGLYIAQGAYDYTDTTSNSSTIVYKFEINDGKTAYVAKREIDGIILNQFAMDENEGYFRIATTSEYYDWSDEWESEISNNLFILNSKMKVVGKLTDLAPDEQIYSVRFMGDRAYVVTYRQVDPLFVIDLENPEEPVVLGELKIEGYSSYLHPYDETHIIGIGMDTKQINENRVETYGMKMAMFDVTDPTNPIEMFTEKIGDKGTYSSLLYNHKALLFSKEKELLAFPIIIYKGDNYDNIDEVGAIIYNINLEDGFTKKGVISHVENVNDKTKYEYQLTNSVVERIIYIGNNFYTMSRNTVKCSDMETLKEISKISIDVKEDEYYIKYAVIE